jgi:signal transduction histidine kinase
LHQQSSPQQTGVAYWLNNDRMIFTRFACNPFQTANLVRYLLCLLCLVSALSAQARDVASDSVIGIVTERGWVEDPSGQMTLDDVKQAEQTRFSGVMFSQGYSESYYWVRLHIDPTRLSNQSVQNLVIRLRPPYLDHIWLYDPLAADDRVRVTGDYYDWTDDEYQSLNLNFVIPVGTDPRDVWLRLKSSASTLMFIEVLTFDEVRAADRRQEVFTAIYLSALLICLGWAVLARINRKDRILTFFVIREVIVLLYALAVLGYLRVFTAGWLPPGWLNHAVNMIAFAFITVVVLFDWKLIGEFKPNRWLARIHGSLVLFFPISIVLVILGQTNAAIRLSSLVILATLLLALSSAISTRAWQQARGSKPEEQPICSKTVLVSVYALATFVALLHRLPLMGASSGSDVFVYMNLAYPLLTSIMLMLLVQVRLHGMAKQQQQSQLRLEMAELEVTKEKAQRVEQANFLKMLAHEMKTPLSVIRMTVGQAPLPAQSHEMVDRAVADMDSIIERLVQVERLEDDRIDLRRESIDLPRLLTGICQSLQGGGRVQTSLEGDLVLESDQQLVRVVISNLIENALKYSPFKSPVNVSLKGDGQALTILVENQVGRAGFPDPAMVFEKYYRAGLAREQTGSGLGLYLVRALVTLLGGSVSYEQQDEHIRFAVRLPWAP